MDNSHRKIRILSLVLILFGPAALQSEVTLEKIEVTSRVDSDAGAVLQTGVDLYGLEVSDYKGQELMLVARFYRDSGSAFPTKVHNFTPGHETVTLEKTSFLFSHQELIDAFGEGHHILHVIVFLVPDGGRSQTYIPDSYRSQTFTMSLFSADADPRAREARLAREADRRNGQITELEDKYGIRIITGKFDIEPATSEDYAFDFLDESDAGALTGVIDVFYEYWNRFPADFIEASGIEAVAFVKQVIWKGMAAGGGLSDTGDMVFCSLMPAYEAADIEHKISHEFFHLIEKNYMFSGFFSNDRWKALNPPGTEYSSVLEMAESNPRYALEEHPKTGFVTGYCLADVYQDKAETFSYLTIPSYYARAAAWMRNDGFLQAKFDFLKTGLRRISPTMSEYF